MDTRQNAIFESGCIAAREPMQLDWGKKEAENETRTWFRLPFDVHRLVRSTFSFGTFEKERRRGKDALWEPSKPADR